MRKLKVAGMFAAAVLFAATIAQALPQAATNFVGTWDMTMSRGGPGGPGGAQGGGENGGGGGRRGGGPSSLVITKDGDNYKVVHKTPRGDVSSSATSSGNTLSWTEEREGRDGNTMKINFKATIDGDTMKGSLGGGQFNREFTAKRSAS
jgi:hypothetical protein